jgi:hypothetical protein
MKIFKSLVLILLISCAILCFLNENHTKQSNIKQSFEINKPYLNVLKDFSTKNSLEKIVEQNNAVLLDKKWEYLNIEVVRIRKPRQWNVDGRLIFIIETKDSDLGKQKLEFYQDIDLKNNVMIIKTSLASPGKNIILCERTIKFFEKEQKDKTLVEIESKLEVKKLIPKFFIKTMDKKVDENNLREVENLKNNILEATKGENAIISILLN